MAAILVIEDDASLRRLLRRKFEGVGHSVLESASGRGSLGTVRRSRPDLIVTDWMLPGSLRGVDICRELKASRSTRSIPIIVLTGAMVGFEDELEALSQGADLFLTKEVLNDAHGGFERLLGYVQSLLSRPGPGTGDAACGFSLPGVTVDFERATVRTPAGEAANFSTKEIELLRILAAAYPGMVSRRRLVKVLWNDSVRDREVDVMVCRLKTKLRGAGVRESVIETVHRRGYRLAEV